MQCQRGKIENKCLAGIKCRLFGIFIHNWKPVETVHWPKGKKNPPPPFPRDRAHLRIHFFRNAATSTPVFVSLGGVVLTARPK